MAAIESGQDRSHDVSASVLNTSSGSGRQVNNNQIGDHTQSFSANTINYIEARESTPQPTHTIPFSRDPGFISRNEFDNLQHLLQRPGAPVVVVGLGGVGKSQLAIEHCYRVRDVSPETWVFWIHASSAVRFDQDLRKLVEAADIPGHSAKEADIFTLAYNWLSRNCGKWLVVLDNADNADFLFEAPQASNGARPRIDYLSQHGSILVTSRYRAVAEQMTDSDRVIHLQPDQRHAIELLRSKLNVQEDATAIEHLAGDLEYMPLAVVQATAYINKRAPRCSVREYVDRLGKSTASKTSLLQMEAPSIRRDRSEANNSILLAWTISFEHISNLRPSAARLLSLMSFFDHQGVADALMVGKYADDTAGSDPGTHELVYADHARAVEDFKNDLVVLQDYSFVSTTPDGADLQMHNLVQLATHLWLRQEQQYASWEARSFKALRDAWPPSSHEHWREWAALYPHAKLALSAEPEQEAVLGDLASILYAVAFWAIEQGKFRDAEAAARRVNVIISSVQDVDGAAALHATALLSTVLFGQEQYEKAQEVESALLERRTRLLGDEHPNTLTSMNNLAEIYRLLQRFKDAEKMHLKVLNIRRRVLGPEHTDTLTTMSNLAQTYGGMQQHREAAKLGEQVLETRSRRLGPDHPSTFSSMNNLAMAFHALGRDSEAMELQIKALEWRRRVLGVENPKTVTSMGNLALIHLSLDEFDEAEKLQIEALQMTRRMLGAEHPKALIGTHALARTQYRQGKLQSAESLMASCAEAAIRVHGEEHPYTRSHISLLEDIQMACATSAAEPTLTNSRTC